jgi:hypothetical protein
MTPDGPVTRRCNLDTGHGTGWTMACGSGAGAGGLLGRKPEIDTGGAQPMITGR